MRTRVVTIAALKGGVAKTTLTACLAVQAAKEGAAVAMLDWEPQGSLTIWHSARGRPDNPELVPITANPIEEVSRLKSEGLHDWVFLDTAPSGLAQVEQAIKAADLVLIPVPPAFLDLAAVRVVAADAAENEKPFAFVLTRENMARRALSASAIVHLGKLAKANRPYGHVLTQHMQDRNAYVSATGLGKTGPEHPDSKQAKDARAEIEAIWREVKRIAGVRQ